jgi:hypothetical protein
VQEAARSNAPVRSAGTVDPTGQLGTLERRAHLARLEARGTGTAWHCQRRRRIPVGALPPLQLRPKTRAVLSFSRAYSHLSGASL